MTPADVQLAEIMTGRVNERTLKRGTCTVMDHTSGGQLRPKGKCGLHVRAVYQPMCMTGSVEAGRYHVASTGQCVNQAKVGRSTMMSFGISKTTPETREAENRITWMQQRHTGHAKARCLHYQAD